MKNYLASASPAADTALPNPPSVSPVQRDGTTYPMPPKATKAPLQPRSASPSSDMSRSGLEGAMGALANKLHPPKLRR